MFLTGSPEIRGRKKEEEVQPHTILVGSRVISFSQPDQETTLKVTENASLAGQVAPFLAVLS